VSDGQTLTAGQMVAVAIIVLVAVAWFCVWAVTPRDMTGPDDSAGDDDQ